MSANGVSISAACADGHTLAQLSAAIQARANLLRAETTESATKATAINVLRSLRAETSVVRKRPQIIGDRYDVNIEETGFSAGWASPGRENPKGRRVVRNGRGGKHVDRVAGCRVVNLAGRYSRNAPPKVWRLSISNLAGAGKFYPARADSVLCIARSRGDVEKFAFNRIARRIGQYRGISKRALGLAMHQVAGTATTSDTSAADIRRLLGRVVRASASGAGFGAGRYSVDVLDGLPAAALALKNGQQSVALAIQRAANATVATINRKCNVPFFDRLPTPFPEASRRNS